MDALRFTLFARQRRRPIGISDAGRTILVVQKFLSVRLLLSATLCVSTVLFQTFAPLTSFCAEPTTQQIERTVAQALLPPSSANKWKATGGMRVVTGKDCESLPDGEIGLEYGLNTVAISKYTDGKDHYLVERFEMRFPSSAYGFFTFLQSRETKNQRQFWSGRQVIRVRNERGTAPVNAEFFKGLSKAFGTHSTVLPPLPKHLPKTNQVAEGELYIVGPKALASHPRFSFLKEAVNFEGGTEAVTAEYQQAETPFGLLLLEFHTPQLATDGFAKLDSLKAALAEPARAQTIIKRIGNYVAVANPVKDAKAAEAVLGEIKYTAVVHWEGKTYRAIPLEYRPPDAAALEEASETALILLRTFYWIGLMIALAAVFGVFAGSSFFYWRRYQRRKAGLDDLFSDGGGAIRLNLEEEPEKQKLLN